MRYTRLDDENRDIWIFSQTACYTAARSSLCVQVSMMVLYERG